MLSRIKQLYLVTPAVYAAVIMGGGYGTGREVVEYFSRFGAGPGLIAIGSSALAFFLILFSSFEVVRRTNQHDYRSFFKVLLGRFWWLYELLYPLLFILVIGVISASVVELSQDRLSLPPAVSLTCLMVAVLVMTLIGKSFIEGFLTAWTGFMYCVFTVFLWVMWPDNLDLSLQSGISGSAVDWLGSGLLYAGYNAAIFPVLLYAVRGLQSLQQSAVVAALTAAAICLPAVLFHLSYQLDSGDVLLASLPNYYMVTHYGGEALVLFFSVALVGTLIETALGLVQGIIERLEHANDQALSPQMKSIIVFVLLSSGALAGKIGVVSLIAKGYGALSIGLILVYVVPVTLWVIKATFFEAGSKP